MNVIFCIRCCDQKQQIDRLAVERLIFYAFRDDHGCQSGTFHRVALPMGNGNAVADSCRSFKKKKKNLFFIRPVIGNIAGFLHERDRHLQALSFVGRRRLQRNALPLK